jgi:signal transduction histidine kinase
VAVVLLCSDFSDLAHSTEQGVTILLSSLVVALILILTATVLFAHSFVRPIRQLKSTALQLAAGDYHAKTEIDRSDEVGELSRAMDVLAVRLEEARISRERAEHEKQEFLSRISHELKTPVTVIRGSLEALDEGLVKTPEERTVYYHQMLTESIWLQKLITSLLDLTRLQTLNYPLASEEVDMVELLGDVLMSARAMAERRQIAVVCTPPTEPCTTQGDYDRLRQLVMILIDNAVKYSSPHTQITLCLDPKAQILAVQDEGAGIAPEVLPELFTSYYRGDRQDRNGTGLGLAIAAEIAKRHGFALTVQSAPGKGSRFELHFANKSKNKADDPQNVK